MCLVSQCRYRVILGSQGLETKSYETKPSHGDFESENKLIIFKVAGQNSSNPERKSKDI